MGTLVTAVLYVATTSFVSASRDSSIFSSDMADGSDASILADFIDSDEQIVHSGTRKSCECFRDLTKECPRMEDFGHTCDDRGGWAEGKCADAGLGVITTRQCCPRTCCERSGLPNCEMTCAEINEEAKMHVRDCSCVEDLAPRRCRIMAAFKRTCGDGEPFECQNGQVAKTPEACCPQTCCQEGLAPTCSSTAKDGLDTAKAFCEAIDAVIRRIPQSKKRSQKLHEHQQKMKQQRCKVATVQEASGEQRPVAIGDDRGTVVILEFNKVKSRWEHTKESSSATKFKVMDADWNFANGCTWKCDNAEHCKCGFFPGSG